MREKLEKLRAAFYAAHRSVKNLLTVSDELCSPHFQIHGAFYSSSKSLKDVWKELEHVNADFETSTLMPGAQKGEPYLLSIERSKQELKSSTVSDKFARAIMFTSPDGLICIVSLRSDYTIIRRFLFKYLYPTLSSVSFRTNQLFTTLSQVVHADDTIELWIKDYTTNSFQENDANGSLTTKREWFPHSPRIYSDVFSEFRDDDQWIKALGIELIRSEQLNTRKKKTSSDFRLKRSAEFICEKGFSQFYDAVLLKLSTVLAKNVELLKNRSLSTSPTKASRPLQIQFSRNVFEDKTQHRRLIDVLNKLNNSNLSVYHPNPYLHASLMDYLDGSSYSLWITEHNSLLIVPELKASVASFERVCNYICERFEDGEVTEIEYESEAIS